MLHELYELRDRGRVFRDRDHAGHTLAGLLAPFRRSEARVLAIPAGGVPVAAAIAGRLGFLLDVAVVNKITLPWNSECGYGAVAFDGSVRLNFDLIDRSRLEDAEVVRGIEKTRHKVRRRVTTLRGGAGPPELSDHPVILVDDGLASGITMRAAIEAVRKAGAQRIAVAVPTGHRSSIVSLVHEVDELFCACVCAGWSFAVADAYTQWGDVSEAEAARLLALFHSRTPGHKGMGHRLPAKPAVGRERRLPEEKKTTR
jgi:predicted phosphoribosyltransferase